MDKRIGPLIVSAALAACGGTESSPGFTVVDSAGIEVVTNATSEWAPGEEWTVQPDAAVSIGAVEGDPAYLFGTVRSTGWLPDGRIFVADETAHQIRLYSADGTHVRDIGREGEGPGELGWIWTAGPYRGDSLYVYDYSRLEVSVFDTAGAYARRLRNPLVVGNYWVRGVLPDGRFLLHSPGHGRFEGGPGIRPDSTFVVAIDPTGVEADTLSAFQLRIALVGDRAMADPLHLAPYAAFHANGARMVWTEGTALQFTEASPAGAVERVARIESEPVPVTDAHKAEFKASYLGMMDREASGPVRDRVAASLEEAEYYPLLPATSNIKVAADGNVWVAHYAYPGSHPDRWEVFSAEGRWLGTVTTPPGLEVHAVGERELLGLFTDELGVSYVRVHRIVKP